VKTNEYEKTKIIVKSGLIICFKLYDNVSKIIKLNAGKKYKCPKQTLHKKFKALQIPYIVVY
jgi:hypothetical protein